MSGTLNLLDVARGTALRLKDGRTVEVTENPGDGLWLFCRDLDGGDEGPVCATDIAGRLKPDDDNP